MIKKLYSRLIISQSVYLHKYKFTLLKYRTRLLGYTYVQYTFY